MSPTYQQHSAMEVEWYRKHGKHQTRIKRDPLGMSYVEGDWAWNRNHPHAVEWVRMRLASHVYVETTGIRI